MDGNKENQSSLPAPMTDIKIRTMSSDLQSMGMSGGIPQVTVRQIPTVNLNPADQIQSPAAPRASTGSKKIIYIILSVVGVVILFVVGFFLPKLLFNKETPAPTVTPGKNTQTQATSTPQVKPTQTTGITHSSFFKSASGGITNIAISTGLTTENISGLITQQTAPISASFAELSFNKDGKAISWKEFINIYSWAFLPEAFFTDNFKEDFTSYVHKDSLGTFPGYVLELKPDATIVLLRSQLLQIESNSSQIAKIFLSSPINPGPSFADAQINGQPVRMLQFGSGEKFYYGWFNNKYLVFGTSEEGMRTAFSKL